MLNDKLLPFHFGTAFFMRKFQSFCSLTQHEKNRYAFLLLLINLLTGTNCSHAKSNIQNSKSYN